MNDEIAKEVEQEKIQEVMQQALVEEDGIFSHDSGMGGHAICPRCKWDTRQLDVPISEDDKKEFLRTMLGDTPFSKEYSIFNGGLIVKFSDLTSQEADVMVGIMNQLEQDNLFLPKAIKIKILFALDGIKKGDTTIPVIKPTPEMGPDDVLKLYDGCMGNLPETICGAIGKLYNEFSELLVMLAEAGFDENFWKGAGRD